MQHKRKVETLWGRALNYNPFLHFSYCLLQKVVWPHHQAPFGLQERLLHSHSHLPLLLEHAVGVVRQSAWCFVGRLLGGSFHVTTTHRALCGASALCWTLQQQQQIGSLSKITFILTDRSLNTHGIMSWWVLLRESPDYMSVSSTMKVTPILTWRMLLSLERKLHLSLKGAQSVITVKCPTLLMQWLKPCGSVSWKPPTHHQSITHFAREALQSAYATEEENVNVDVDEAAFLADLERSDDEIILAQEK